MARNTLKEIAEQIDDYMANDDNSDIMGEDDEEDKE
jgi:hypothetical protein